MKDVTALLDLEAAEMGDLQPGDREIAVDQAYRRLALAVIWRAKQDAGGGDAAAREFLRTSAIFWLDLLGVDLRPSQVNALMNPRIARGARSAKEKKMSDKNNVDWGANTGPNVTDPAKRRTPRKPRRLPISNDKPKPAARPRKEPGPADKAATPTSK